MRFRNKRKAGNDQPNTAISHAVSEPNTTPHAGKEYMATNA